MDSILTHLLDDLAAATSFEDRAEIILDQLAVEFRRAHPQATLLQGVLHFRPRGDYELLIQRTWSDRELPLRTSMTAWASIQHRRCPIWIDVELGDFRSLAGDSWSEDRDDEHGFQDTYQQLIAQEVSHLLAIPLARPGELLGMITLEVAWLDRVGRPVAWQECGETLRTLTDLGAMYLHSVPHRVERVSSADLPYAHVGERMKARLRTLQVLAADPKMPLFLRGETGTGKTTLARWCHAHSPRRDGPFVKARSNLTSSELVRSHLFGHRKGSFTGADQNQPGIIAQADGGTLLFDEVDQLPQYAQLGLLDFLETGRFRPLGAAEDSSADVRVIVCSNAPQAALRGDFYHRLGACPIHIPPLSERLDELPAWAEHFASYKAAELSRCVRITGAAMDQICATTWTGNLRQLQQVMARACLFAAGPGEVIIITPDVLSQASNPAQSQPAILHHLDQLARAILQELRRRAVQEEAPLSLKAHGLPLVGQVVLAADEAGVGWRRLAIIGGLERLVNKSNHLVYFRDAIAALQALCRTLGAPPPPLPPGLRKRGRL